MIICIIIMAITAFFAFYAMFGYPMIIILLGKFKKDKAETDIDFEPTVSYMIVAHNEEKVILQKLENALKIDYPKEKFQILVASDFCTDLTDEIVQNFIDNHKDYNIILNKSIEHKGKTNAQNETQKLATGEILVMTDANSMFETNAIRELVSYFYDKKVAYVCGKLKYVNNDNLTSSTESLYWKLDLKVREIESRFHAITAGNGSIYAVRNEYYVDVDPIYCHDSEFPYLFTLKKKLCLYNSNAISYEKAGECNVDEFKRKVRMNRTILNVFIRMWKPFNVFKYGWFSFFYFVHRTCRYLLWLNHIAFFITSVVFTCIGYYIAGAIIVSLQLLALFIGFISIKHTSKILLIRLIGYYMITVLSQIVAAFKQMTGKSKPTWEKAESTR